MGGLSDSPMQVLLKELLAAFALLSPIAHHSGLLAERVVEALRGGQQWVEILALRALAEARGRWRRVLPNLLEHVVFDPEKAFLI